MHSPGVGPRQETARKMKMKLPKPAKNTAAGLIILGESCSEAEPGVGCPPPSSSARCARTPRWLLPAFPPTPAASGMGFASFSPAGWDERGQRCPQHHPERCSQRGPQQHAQNPHQHPLGKVRGDGTACKCQLYFLANPIISTKSFLFPPHNLWLVACEGLYEIFSKESHHRERGREFAGQASSSAPRLGEMGNTPATLCWVMPGLGFHFCLSSWLSGNSWESPSTERLH